MSAPDPKYKRSIGRGRYGSNDVILCSLRSMAVRAEWWNYAVCISKIQWGLEERETAVPGERPRACVRPSKHVSVCFMSTLEVLPEFN